jgi:mannose-6-phosphate isomerase-like protein (cupin superfamily)
MNDYIQQLDPAKFDPEKFTAYSVFNRTNGSQNADVRFARVPPHGSAPDLHTHPVDKFFFVLSGLMNIEIDGKTATAGPNSLISIPAGVPHRNWNEGDEAEVHMVIFVPHPRQGEPNSTPVAR